MLCSLYSESISDKTPTSMRGADAWATTWGAWAPRWAEESILVRQVRTCAVRVSKISFFCKILQIFGGLAPGCIKTKFCKKICV